MKQPNIPALLAGSLDVKYERFNAALMLLLPAPFLICLVPAVMLDMLLPAAALLGILLIFALSIGAYFWNRANALLKNPEAYRLYTAVPVRMHATFWRTIYLELEVYAQDGTTFLVDSRPSFNASVMSSRYFGDYFGQQLDLLLDAEGHRVVVVGKKGEYRG